MVLRRHISKECFVSHCSDDKEIMEHFSNLIHSICREPRQFFNTSERENAIRAGEDRAAEVRKHLKRASFMIAFITDNYLRSAICLSELSSFWYTQKNVLPIIFNLQTGVQLLTDIFGKDIIYINACSDFDPNKAANDLLKALESNGVQLIRESSSAQKYAAEFFSSSRQASPRRPYIGSSEQFKSVLDYCNKSHIKQITDSTLSTQEIFKKLDGFRELYIISTTGANLISALSSEFLPSVLKKGTNITLLLPNQYSDVCNDVAEIEMPENPDINAERLANEFFNVVINLIKTVNSCSDNPRNNGKIEIGCAFTYLRQTIIMGVNKDGTSWGWMSITLPPRRTNDKTPSIEFCGNINEESTIAHSAYQHVSCIKQIAKARNKLIEIKADMREPLNFGLERVSAEKQWKEFYKKALSISESYMRVNTDELIEVAAQHPLQNNGQPAHEFQMRLDYAVILYNKLKNETNQVKIYVPGSVHQKDGTVDIQSLSDAGKAYLMKCGIPEKDIFGDEMNRRYKGEDGVYNSADECFVASQIFLNNRFKTLHCVCSPNQMTRKQLFYIYLGVLPFFHTVPCEKLAHNIVHELIKTIPDVILNDHSWQGEDSYHAIRTRAERKP